MESIENTKEEVNQAYLDFKEKEQEFTIENEEDGTLSFMEKPFNPKDIDIISRTMSLDNIIKRLQEDEIDLAPDFQRSMNL